MEGLNRIGKVCGALQIFCTNHIMISAGAHPDIPTGVHEVYSDLDVFHRAAKGVRWYQMEDWVPDLNRIYPSFDKGQSICKGTLLWLN